MKMKKTEDVGTSIIHHTAFINKVCQYFVCVHIFAYWSIVVRHYIGVITLCSHSPFLRTTNQ